MNIRFHSRARRAFTLLELTIVVIIIGILAAVIVPRFGGMTQDARISSAKGNLAQIENAIEVFHVHMDRYPTSEEGLKVLVEAPSGDATKWRGPYIKQLLNDPWGEPFQYRIPGTHHPTGFDLWSRGADKVDGGEAENADVGNW